MGVSGWEVLSASLTAGALGLTFGAVAFLVGAATGHKALAIGLQQQQPSPRTSSTRSPPSWTSSSRCRRCRRSTTMRSATRLRQGVAPTHLVFLIAVAAVAAAAGIVLFDRRDLHAA